MRTFNKRKITPEMKEEIRVLHDQGIKKKDIAKKYGVTPTTIGYHLSKEIKKKRLESVKEYQKNLTPKQKEERKSYYRDYMKHRYNTDEKFRERIINNTKRYQKRKQEEQDEANTLFEDKH